MNLKEMLAAAIKAAQDIVDGAKGRSMTDTERVEVEAKIAEATNIKAQIKAAEGDDALMGRLASFGAVKGGGDDTPAKSLGEHFVKSLGDRSIKGMTRFEAPEFKAAADTHGSGGTAGDYGPLVTDIDRSFVLPYQRPLVIADIIPSGPVSGSAITYPVFGALEGNAATVAEGGAKPQIHIADPTWKTDALGEVAAFFKLTDDMAEDLPYVAGEIETTARYDLLLQEEVQILSGGGVSPNLDGIMHRSGVQTAVKGADTVADAIFKTFSLISGASPFAADFIVINPEDYEALRLTKDGNEQYYGGGFFSGTYGNGAIVMEPPIWGRRTVVTQAITAGTFLIGASRAAKILRKGGLRVESTNSHADDFTNDKITVRIKERLGLQVKWPSAFVKLTLV